MPFALLIAGIVLVVAAVRGTQDELFALLKGDFTGPKNYIYWVITIVAVGVLGYVPRMQTFSRAFLVLIGIALLLSNKGFFQKFQEQISTTEARATND